MFEHIQADEFLDPDKVIASSGIIRELKEYRTTDTADEGPSRAVIARSATTTSVDPHITQGHRRVE